MGTTSEVAGEITELPRSATQRVRGNPLAVGLIALGAGVVVASLLPRSETERELAKSTSDGLQTAPRRKSEAPARTSWQTSAIPHKPRSPR